MKKCPYCSGEMDEKAVFCPTCGSKVESAEGQSQPEGATVQLDEEPVQTEGTPVKLGKEKAPAAGMGYSGEHMPTQQPVKKKGKVKVIIGGAVVAAAAAVGIFAGVKLLEKDPKDVVIDAFKGVYSSENTNPSEELFGWNAFAENSMKKSMEGGFSLSFDQSSSEFANMFAGSELTSVSKYDVKNKQIYGTIGTKVANMDLATLELYMDQEKMAMSIPELSSRVFSIDYANDLEGQIADSPMVGQVFLQSGMDPAVFKDYMDYIWSFYGEEGERPFDLKALWNRYKEGSAAINSFKEAMVVEKADSAEFTVNGKTVKCKGYDVVISQQAMIDFVKTTSQFFIEDESLKKDVLEYLSQIVAVSGNTSIGMTAEEMQEQAWTSMKEYMDQLVTAMETSVNDIHMTVYVDKKGNLAAFQGTTDLEVEEETCTISVDTLLKGGTYPTENAEMTVTAEGTEGTMTVEIVKEGTYDDTSFIEAMDVTAGDGETTFRFSSDSTYDIPSGDYKIVFAGGDGDVEGKLTMEGTVSNLTPGETFDISMDKIGIIWNEEELAALSGSYSMKPLEGEITMPEGQEIDVLAATQEEWQEIGEEIVENGSGIAQMFTGLMNSAATYWYMMNSR